MLCTLLIHGESIREMKLKSTRHSPTLRDRQQHTYNTRTYNNRNIPKMKLNSYHMKHRQTQISTPYIVVENYIDVRRQTRLYLSRYRIPAHRYPSHSQQNSVNAEIIIKVCSYTRIFSRSPGTEGCKPHVS